VLLSHANLLHNQKSIHDRFGHNVDGTVVGWLPLYHDMGLIGNVLQSIYAEMNCVLMSPQHFLQRPIRWLQAISRFSRTTSGAPEFAFAMCANRIRDDEISGLDLSGWRVAFSGAEMVRPRSLELFARRFAVNGFQPSAFLPCYGLAEATLLVTGSRSSAGPRYA